MTLLEFAVVTYGNVSNIHEGIVLGVKPKDFPKILSFARSSRSGTPAQSQLRVVINNER